MLRIRPIAGHLVAMTMAITAYGCSTLQPVADRTGDAIKKYCEQPYNVRLEIRNQVNAAAAPHTAKISCAGDPPDG